MSSAARTILTGNASDLDLISLLEASSLGRQVLRLEVLGPSGAVIGHVVMKGGQIVAGSAGALQGMQALKRLSSAVNQQAKFRVLSTPMDARLLGTPLATVSMFTGLLKSGHVDSEAPPAIRSERAPSSRVRMMEGSLSEFDMPTLLQTVSLGRQFIELEVQNPSGKAVGTMSLKSGQVVSAHAGETDGVSAVYQLLSSPPTARFSVFRLNPPGHLGEPLGTINELLMEHFEATQAAPKANGHPSTLRPTASPGIPIMEGLLSDFDLASVLQTIGIGRQHTSMTVTHRGADLGTIEMKAGQVLTAVSKGSKGIQAVRMLLGAPADARFLVLRLTGGAFVGEPLGSLGSILMKAMGAEGASQTPKGVTTFRPPADNLRVPIMEGKVGEVDIGVLLETVGLSRQFTGIEVHAPHGVLGSIYLKAGMVISVMAGAKRGIDALTDLVAAGPNMNFKVFRMQAVPDAVEPLGSIMSVLLRLPRPAAAPPAPVAAAPAPAPPPADLGSTLVMQSPMVAPPPAPAPVPPASAPPPPTASVQEVPPPVADISPAIASPSMADSALKTEAARGMGATMKIAIAVGAIAALVAAGVFAQGVLHEEAPRLPSQAAGPKAVETATATTAAPTATVTATATVAATATATVAPVATATAAPTATTAATDTKPAAQPQVQPTPAVDPQIAKAQGALKTLGFDPGKVDSIHGPRTAAAIASFQKANGLAPTGTLNADTLRVLEEKRARP